MPPLNCGNLELTLNQGTRAARSLSAPDHETAYEVLLKGHAYEFVDGEPIFDRTATQLDDIQQNLEDYLSKHKKPIIVIHFHGGLVDRCNGYTGAASLLGAYEGAGAFPIFPIYNVGIGESIDKGWSGASARDPRYGGDGRAMSFSRRFLYPRGLLAEPVTDTRSIAVIDRHLMMVHERNVRIEGQRRHEDATTSRNDTLTTREEELRLGLVPGLDEGYATGGRAWSYMKWVIDRSLAIDSNANWTTDRTQAAMLHLLDAIHALTSRPGKRPASIVLVGHSTGAIYAAKFLRAWQIAADGVWKDPAAKQQRFTMLFMAPAIRYDTLERALNDDTARMLDGRFRTFTMYDGAERDSYDGPFPATRTAFYRFSLLYAVSGIFEQWPDAPIYGLQRFACPPFASAQPDDYVAEPAAPKPDKLYAYSRYTERGKPDLASVAAVHKWFKEHGVANEFAFSPAPHEPAGMRTTAIAHGDFPRDYATMSSVATLVSASWASGNQPPWNARATNGDCRTKMLHQ